MCNLRLRFLLVWGLFFFVLLCSGAEDSTNEKSNNPFSYPLPTSTTPQLETPTELKQSLEMKLSDLEQLAMKYLEESSLSDQEWEQFIKDFQVLQLAVTDLTLLGTVWQERYSSLFELYEKAEKYSLKEREAAQAQMQAMQKIINSQQIQIRTWQIGTAVAVTAGVVGWALYFIVK
jgi:hypothetical protein